MGITSRVQPFNKYFQIDCYFMPAVNLEILNQELGSPVMNPKAYRPEENTAQKTVSHGLSENPCHGRKPEKHVDPRCMVLGRLNRGQSEGSRERRRGKVLSQVQGEECRMSSVN